jgi:serine/threonine protein kinase
MDIANLSAGMIIAERYQLAELLGAGGSSSTYRAIRIEDGTSVAIKILSLRHLNDWKQLELFEREAKVLAQLHHPQIPKYLEYFHVDTPDNRAFYIVQQLAPGKPLTAWVQSGWRGTETEVRDIASQLLAILQYLHHQSPPLIHRDLKPHNIIRNDDGHVFLVDFGTVQDVYHNTLLKGSTVAGTYGYMAPEQFRGLAVPESDLYGLGATILYLLTHRSPADLPQERLKLNFHAHVNISASFADWMEMMLEPDLTDRFSSVDVALDALQQQYRFRIQRGNKIGFPWKSAAITAAILTIFVPLVHQYRYALLTRIGLPPRDLCNVIRQNDVKSLNEYLAHGVSVNATAAIHNDDRDETGSLLHCAIESRQPEIMAILIEKGADLHALNGYGKSLLMFAVEVVNDSAIRDLIRAGADPHAVDERGFSLWHFLDWYNYDRKDNTAANRSIAKQLMAAKVDINKQNFDGDTPLHSVVNHSNQSAIDILLSHKARTDIRNQQGNTPLIAAIVQQRLNIVELLISRGVGVNVVDKDDKTPLMVAIDTANNNYEFSNHFTSQSFVDLVVPSVDLKSTTPKIIDLLLRKGADPNLADRDGNTALHLIGKLGETSITWDGCYQNRSLAIYTLDSLIQHHANIQSVNKDGDTALHVLARQDFFPVTDRMIKYGGDSLQKNREGKTAVDLIKAAGSRVSRCPSNSNNIDKK